MRHIPALAICALSLIAQADAATPQNPAVVEVFTSQGCSTCPPTDANVRALAGRPDVLALSFAVTYWDKLGWKDTFGQDIFTRRQRDYEPPLHEHSPFTPQVVVDGRMDTVGNNRADIERLIAQSNRTGGPAVQLGSDSVAVGAGQGDADVWVVRYDPNTVSVPVSRGENAGTTIQVRNAVHELIMVGRWNGTAQQYKVPQAHESGLKTAVLVQTHKGGPILSVARD
ncbi:MAG TPA: DUF1223 domain-containing protein [Rhizomicrobium sp.]